MSKADKKNTALSPAQYWEWRTTVTELHLAIKDSEKAHVELNLLNKETEVAVIKQKLFQSTRMEVVRLGIKTAQAEYERYTKVLEDSIGLSLKNKIIDDVTYEIKEVPTNK